MASKATDVYDLARERVDALFARTSDPHALCEGVCEILNTTIPTHSWVGIYLVEGSDLVLDAWRGPAATEHVRIPIGQGICGYAAAHKESIIVPDVAQDPRYLQCFLSTRSEIVVPIMHGDQVLGEIDVDGDEVNAFGAADQDLLEEIAARLGQALARSSER